VHRLGIVVPFRNRWEHLDVFYKEVIPYLTKSKIDFRVIVVEQDDASAFNRGMLCNIGFLQAKKLNCDYIVFHDVDMIPLDIDYSFSEHPVHLASDELPFDTYFGGITLFPVNDFEKINGFSNHYWGWGFEDDDLRYRCDLENINYGNSKTPVFNNYTTTSYLNGVDAYIEVENKIKFIRNFNIEIDLRIGEIIYDVDKAVDYFTILCIKGNDLALKFTSFNRFTLQWFDKKGIYYDITSNVITNRSNKVSVTYNTRENTMTFKVNNEFEKTVLLKNKIHNYSNEKNIIIGTDTNKEEFFKGGIDKVKITNNSKEVFVGSNDNIENYFWTDTSNNSTGGKFYKVDIRNYTPDEFLGRRVPYRRESKIKRLSHEDSGFINGRWKHDMTRWNQLRFNNEVVNGDKDHKTDGINTCEFTYRNKERKGRVLHIKVGI